MMSKKQEKEQLLNLPKEGTGGALQNIPQLDVRGGKCLQP